MTTMLGLTGAGVLKVAAPVALGLWTFQHVGRIIARMKIVGDAKKALAQTQAGKKDGKSGVAAKEERAKPVTGIPPVDAFLAVITPFFDALLDSAAGNAIFMTIMSVAAPGMAFFAFEGLREGATTLHFAFPVLALLSQILGISVIIPLLWIPLYLLTVPITTGSVLSAGAVASVAVGLALGQLPTAFMTSKPPSNLRTAAIQWFQISVALAWIPFAMTPFTHAFDHSIGQLPFDLTPESAFFFALGTALIGVHGLVTSKVVFDRVSGAKSLASRLWTVRSFEAVKNETEGLVCHFMFVDTVVLVVALTYVVAMKGGPEYAAYVLGLVPLIGPGAALSFAFGYLSR